MKPDGIFMAWLDENRVMPKTIKTAFKHIRLYKFFALASNAPLIKDHQKYQDLILTSSPDEQQGFSRLKAEHKGLYLGDEEYVKANMAGFSINQDWKPICEYYLGLKRGL
jgi:hypothetical protein